MSWEDVRATVIDVASGGIVPLQLTGLQLVFGEVGVWDEYGSQPARTFLGGGGIALVSGTQRTRPIDMGWDELEARTGIWSRLWKHSVLDDFEAEASLSSFRARVPASLDLSL